MLKIQIAQQATSSATPSGRLPSKPELNPGKHCNVVVLSGDTQLEGLQGAGVRVKSQKDYDKGVTPLLSENER